MYIGECIVSLFQWTPCLPLYRAILSLGKIRSLLKFIIWPNFVNNNHPIAGLMNWYSLEFLGCVQSLCHKSVSKYESMNWNLKLMPPLVVIVSKKLGAIFIYVRLICCLWCKIRRKYVVLYLYKLNLDSFYVIWYHTTEFCCPILNSIFVSWLLWT